MNLDEKDIKRLSTLGLIIILGIIAFFVVRPILIATITGLILAYVFTPLYRKINVHIKSKNISAWLASILIIAILIIPLWFIFPIVLKQVYELYGQYQSLDMTNIVKSIFPSASDKFLVQTTATLNNLVLTLTSTISNLITNFFLNIPYLLVDLFIIAFVFFYALRDSDKLIDFFRSISPLSEVHQKILVKHFKDMTDSIIYGQVIVGIVQGAFAGLGFAIFGIENALVLTLLAMIFSIIPFLGPFIIWIPIAIFLFANGQVSLGTAYFLYNLLIVSVVDNIVRSYLISKKVKVSPAIIMVGMIGGLYLFNIIGLIIGPLVLAYLVTILESFKDKSVYALFSSNPNKT
ncbi:MAG: AI-2E family transporter [Nanoarchaeota archaeon]|nr:AI-2E family transporter [Nanoarchaeota archaeon]